MNGWWLPLQVAYPVWLYDPRLNNIIAEEMTMKTGMLTG
jgi:hypothetical protein